MVLSEAEAEARLATLARRREALEREIRDLTLFLELGRRLGASEAVPGPAESAAPAPHAAPVGRDTTNAGDVGGAEIGAGAPGSASGDAPPRPAPATMAQATQALRAALRAHSAESDPSGPPAAWDGPPPPAPPSAAARPSEEAGTGRPAVPDGTQARRYGRALIAQTLAILEQAGRPLHAGEILAVLQARGFSVPGHDPVAALNTRLWKRAGPDGVLRRLGDAVYALPEADHGDEA